MKRDRRAVSGFVLFAAPDFFAGGFVQSASEGVFNDDHVAEHQRRSGEAPLGRLWQFGLGHQFDSPMFLAIGHIVASKPTGFAEAKNTFAIHGRRSTRAAFVQVVNKRGGICIAPDFFSGGSIEASEGFEIAAALAGAAQRKHASIGHGHAGKPHANFRAPSNFAKIGLGQRLARDAIVPGSAPVRPILGTSAVCQKEENEKLPHRPSLSGEVKQEKLPFLYNFHVDNVRIRYDQK